MPTIEERLQKLEDAAEISALLTAYGIMLDRRDFAGYAALFAKTGTWTGPYIGSASGPEAIRALMLEKLGAVAGQEPAGAHHIMSNMAIEVSGNNATAWSRWTFVVPGEQRMPSLALSGHYDDILIRENGRWKFSSRVVSGDLPGVMDSTANPENSAAVLPAASAPQSSRTNTHERIACDIEAIRRLLIEYGRTLDRRDFKAYAALFARDGEWIGAGTIGTTKAPDIQPFMEKHIGTAAVRCNHLMTNMLIDLEGDSATAWSRWTLVDADPSDRPQLVYSGHYDDALVREDGVWKFRSRTAYVDIPSVSRAYRD